MIRTENFEQVEVSSVEALWAWFAQNHNQEDSIWLVTYKKQPGAPYVSRDEVLDALIAYGWVDGIRRKLDEARTMQLLSPRKTHAWAQSYKDRAARLIAEGRMQPAGQAAIDASKAAGLWTATAAVDALVVPDDLQSALQAHPPATAYFDRFAPSYRRNVLRWISQAKRPETRAKRIADVAARAAENQKVPQY